MPLSHARGFSIRNFPGFSRVEVYRPWQKSSADFAYRLVRGDNPGTLLVTDPSGSSTPISIPVRRVVTLTTTDLPHLEMLGSLETLVGMGGGRYVCNPSVRALMEVGKVREVGSNPQVDVEAVMQLKPDAVFSYSMGNATTSGNGKLEEAGLQVVLNGSYMEETPLGRAEWIKFTAAFLGKGTVADTAFAGIEWRYRALAALARGAKSRPTVFTQAFMGGLWWVPGGRSYVARYLEDAGAAYLWAEDTTRGSLSLDFESVLARASKADFWLNPGDWRSLEDGLAKDPRHGYFKAFREGRVYASDLITCGEGGNDFYETGSARPDLVLADLVALFHPELLPGHEFRWYRRLDRKR